MTNKPIKVVVHGASGKMGKEVINAICHEEELQLVGAVDLNASQEQLKLPDASGSVPFSSSLEEVISRCKPDVVIDFTIARAAVAAAHTAIKHRVNLVTGTTGVSDAEFEEIDHLARENGVGVVFAANFALGAVMMMHLAKVAAKYFTYAEIIEQHHQEKADAPSGPLEHR
jgi:4-hydroxy-tetrahydrodipicolinate reductase